MDFGPGPKPLASLSSTRLSVKNSGNRRGLVLFWAITGARFTMPPISGRLGGESRNFVEVQGENKKKKKAFSCAAGLVQRLLDPLRQQEGTGTKRKPKSSRMKAGWRKAANQ